MRDTGQKKEELVRTLNKIVRMESFQDDFYRKPLEQMLELSDDAVRVPVSYTHLDVYKRQDSDTEGRLHYCSLRSQ